MMLLFLRYTCSSLTSYEYCSSRLCGLLRIGAKSVRKGPEWRSLLWRNTFDDQCICALSPGVPQPGNTATTVNGCLVDEQVRSKVDARLSAYCLAGNAHRLSRRQKGRMRCKSIECNHLAKINARAGHVTICRSFNVSELFTGRIADPASNNRTCTLQPGRKPVRDMNSRSPENLYGLTHTGTEP